MQKRNRFLYFILIVVTILAGLFSRSTLIPKFIYPYLGDFLYALMFFFIVGFCFNKMSAFKVAFFCITICFLIEVFQLYKADWINEIRSHKIGNLILGNGFLWSDLICYLMGGITGYFLETLFIQKKIIRNKTAFFLNKK